MLSLNTEPAAAAAEQFKTVRKAGYGEVLRGVSFAPERGTADQNGQDE